MSNLLKPITCRAAILYKEGDPLVIESVIIDHPNSEQVRIKVVSAGICASDAHYVFGKTKLSDLMGQALPSVFGHEGAGIVESVGSLVTHLKPGDHVLATFLPMCHNCSYCANPSTNLCQKSFLSRPNKKFANGDDLRSMAGLGVYSEYVLLHSSQAIKIDSRVNLENVCVIGCAVATGFYAATNQAKVLPGTTVAVWGLGAIGLNAVFGCKFAGAKNIIGIDINNDKKSVGIEFGCTEFINPNELDKPIADYLKQKYRGLDYAFDCIGNQTVFDTAFASLSSFGTLALVGMIQTGTKLAFPGSEMVTGKKIIGGVMGNKQADKAYSELVEMYRTGEYNVDRLVTHKFSLDQINEAFQTLKDGKCIRSLIIL